MGYGYGCLHFHREVVPEAQSNAEASTKLPMVQFALLVHWANRSYRDIDHFHAYHSTNLYRARSRYLIVVRQTSWPVTELVTPGMFYDHTEYRCLQ